MPLERVSFGHQRLHRFRAGPQRSITSAYSCRSDERSCDLTVTLGELAVGARNSDDRTGNEARLAAFVRALSVRPFDQAAGEAYGRLARTVGVRRESFDRLIAAHALALEVTLVTSNEPDFLDVPELRIENWTLPLA